MFYYILFYVAFSAVLIKYLKQLNIEYFYN